MMFPGGESIRRSLRRGTLLVVLVLTVTLVHSEVGVPYDPGSGAPVGGPYSIVGMTDEPDPFSYWLEYHPTGTHFAILNPDGEANGDGKPAILYNPVSRLPIVAWARNSASGYDVVVSHFQAGAWSEPFVVAGSPEHELDPHLALDPSNGDVHIFYGIDEATPRVMHRQAPASLSSWSAPVQVSEPGLAACRPAGAFHLGVLRVAYEVHDYGVNQIPRQVVLSRRDNDDFIPEVVAVTYHSGEVRPEVHSHSGRIWIEWIDAADEMAWTRMDTLGQWEPIQYEPYLTREELEFFARGAIRHKAIQ